jgi:hypothetical protein
MNEMPNYDFTIEQGVLFLKSLTWYTLADPNDPKSARTPVNLAGKTLRMQIRSRDGDLIQEVTVTVTNAEQGAFSLGLTTAQTKALDFTTAIHDLEVIRPDNEVELRLFSGIVTLSRESTKDPI